MSHRLPHQLHPWKLTWNPSMQFWKKAFPFLNRWFSGSMLIFQGVQPQKMVWERVVWRSKCWPALTAICWEIQIWVERFLSFRNGVFSSGFGCRFCCRCAYQRYRYCRCTVRSDGLTHELSSILFGSLTKSPINQLVFIRKPTCWRNYIRCLQFFLQNNDT